MYGISWRINILEGLLEMAITGRNRDQVERCAKSLMDMLIFGSDIVPTVKDILKIENH